MIRYRQHSIVALPEQDHSYQSNPNRNPAKPPWMTERAGWMGTPRQLKMQILLAKRIPVKQISQS